MSSSWYTRRRSAAAVGTSFSRPSVSSAAGSRRINESERQRPRFLYSSCSSGANQLQPNVSYWVHRTHRSPSISAAPSMIGTIDLVGR
jgi:hypothetical protein